MRYLDSCAWRSTKEVVARQFRPTLCLYLLQFALAVVLMTSVFATLFTLHMLQCLFVLNTFHLSILVIDTVLYFPRLSDNSFYYRSRLPMYGFQTTLMKFVFPGVFLGSSKETIGTSTRPKHGIQKRLQKYDNPRPERTHHCSTCRAYILEMDHHCPWVVRVNFAHHKIFICFLLYALCTYAFVFDASALFLVCNFTPTRALTSPTWRLPVRRCWLPMRLRAAMMLRLYAP